MWKRMMLAGLMGVTALGGVAPAYAQSDHRGGRGPNGGSVGQIQTSPQQRNMGGYDGHRNNARPTNPNWRGGDNRGNWQQPNRNDHRLGYDGRSSDRRGNPQNGWNNGRNNWGGMARYDDRSRWAGQQRWNNGWRADRRYDWYNYRSHYGDRYRMGAYYAPRGWGYGYRPVSVGVILSSMFYGNNYWISDPGYYRLPPAYGSLQWVRYYDDAMLVDTRDGYVADVINNFFW